MTDTRRTPRPTKAERLQAQWDAASDLMKATIVFHPFWGWVAEPHEARNFNDRANHLGRNYTEAAARIAFLAGETTVPR